MAKFIRRLRKSSKNYEEIQDRSLISDYDHKHISQVRQKDIKAAEKLWNYMLLSHKLSKCEVIIVVGRCDVKTAEYACTLWLEGWADYIVFSGQLINNERGIKENVENFHKIAEERGIPNQKIILDDNSSDLVVNIANSRDILKINGIVPSSIILVHMPFMERIIHTTFMKQWPTSGVPIESLKVIVKSPPVPMRDYPEAERGDLQDLISILVANLQKLTQHPSVGLFVPPKVPVDVWTAYKNLVGTEKYNCYI